MAKVAVMNTLAVIATINVMVIIAVITALGANKKFIIVTTPTQQQHNLNSTSIAVREAFKKKKLRR